MRSENKGKKAIKISLHYDLSRDTVFININGLLGNDTYEAIEEVFDKLFQEQRYRLIVDMTEIDYIARSVLWLFIWAVEFTQGNSGNLVIYNPNKQVKDSFESLQTSAVLPVITRSMRTAVNTFGEK